MISFMANTNISSLWDFGPGIGFGNYRYLVPMGPFFYGLIIWQLNGFSGVIFSLNQDPSKSGHVFRIFRMVDEKSCQMKTI